MSLDDKLMNLSNSVAGKPILSLSLNGQKTAFLGIGRSADAGRPAVM
jgi:hypothetical protein